jgi:hypothetical protein
MLELRIRCASTIFSGMTFARCFAESTKTEMPTKENVEIRLRGKWITVPAVNINGNIVIATGKWLRTATVRGEEMMEHALGDPEVYIDRLNGDAKLSLKADIFTFTQKLPATLPKFRYPFEWESVAAIQLTSFNDWWEKLPQETRKNVRRSQKRGLQVRITEFNDELIEGIREVNNESPLRQGMPNGYYGKSFDETKKLYGDFVGRSDFICAYYDQKLIGFLHLVYRREVASILNLTTMASHFDKRPANALIAKAVELCEAKNISYISYGLYNYGNKRDHPLRTFKIRNGFEEILVPRFFVAVTNWGRVCIAAKLHRGLVGILPHAVIMFAVGVRAKLYRVKMSTRRCSSIVERPNCNRQMERSSPPAGSNT